MKIYLSNFFISAHQSLILCVLRNSFVNFVLKPVTSLFLFNAFLILFRNPPSLMKGNSYYQEFDLISSNESIYPPSPHSQFDWDIMLMKVFLILLAMVGFGMTMQFRSISSEMFSKGFWKNFPVLKTLSVILNCWQLTSQGTFGNVWRHFCLSQLGECYWHLVGRGQG